ncbi:MAG: hypothetical protein CFE21_14590 [Bacteroidetes bacterium B1(2017)]|nr:MAG: hypothetical protein CFE21_14590 [Bacteroidetes bacterium B1(2017)]
MNFLLNKTIKKVGLSLTLLLFLYSKGYGQSATATIGTGTTTIAGTSATNPFGSYFTSSHAQYLITAAELNAAGITGSVALNSLGFNISVAAPLTISSCASGNITAGNQILNYSIKLKNTSATALTTTYDLVGLTTVYNPSTIFTSTGWTNLNFNNSFTWDGVSNLLVDICSDNSNNVSSVTCYTTGPTVLATTTAVNTVTHNWADGVASQCGLVTGTTNNAIRPNMQIGYIAPPMVFSSSTVSQGTTVAVGVGSNDNPIVALQVAVTGLRNPFTVKTINLNTNGSTNIADITNAKIYYSGTSSNFSTATLFGSTTLSSSTFSVTGNQVLSGAGTHYFWLAYDVSASATPNNTLDGEVSSFSFDSLSVNFVKTPTVTAPVGSRIIRPRLNGNYTIGAGGNFTTLTQFINELNSVGVTGPVTANLTDAVYGASELFPITINSYFGMGASNPVVIRPSVSNSNVLIQGNATSLFTYSGAKYITIDGRPGGLGSNNLKFINANTTSPVIQFVNESSVNAINYCTFFSANAGTISGAIVIGGTTGLLGNDSITLSNLNIRSSAFPATLANAIFAQGQSTTAQNDYVTITNNNIYAFTFNGILANGTNTGNGSFWNISNNSFYDTATTTSVNAMTAINFIPAGTTSFSHTISNNYIGGSAPLAAGTAWTISSASGSLTGIAASTSAGVSPTVIQNNIIQNINLTGGAASTFALTGINTSGSGTYTIGGSALTANTIGHASTVSSIRSLNNSAITGITNSGTGIINISFNLIANLTDSNISAAAAIRGINNGSGSIVTISNNNLYNFITQSTNAGVTTAAALSGLAITSSGNPQVISGNTIGGSLGIFRNVQTGTHVMNGIYYAGASANNTISNNVVSNFTSASTAVGVTSSAAMNGLLIASGSTLNTISGNTFSNFTLSGAAANQMNAICETSSSTTNNILNNSIFNFRNLSGTSAGVTTSATVNGMLLNVSTLHNITNNTIDSLVFAGATSAQINGLYLLGTTGNTITGNTISRIYTTSISASSLNSSSIVGMNVSGAGLNQNVSSNTLHTFVNTAAAANANIVGLYFGSSTTSSGNNSVIAKNNFHSYSLSTTTAGAITGMILTSTYVTVQNNIIRIGVNNAGTVLTGPYANRGIFLTAGTYGTAGLGNGLRIYHNTIYLNGTYTSGTSATYCIDASVAVSTGNVDIRNNILANLSSNTVATGLHYGLKLTSVANVNSNFNLFFTPGTGGNAAILSVTPYASLTGATGWRTATKFDVNSASANPNFALPLGTSGTVNMRLQSPTPAEGMGDNTVTTTDNFDGAARSSRTPVDIGADAGNYTLSTDQIAPYITFTPLANVLNGANVTLQASIYDNGGMYTSGSLVPRVYYRKGANGTYTSVAGSLNAGSSRNAQWNFTIDHSLVGGLVGNDTVYYYLIAQDSAGNIASSVANAIATDVNTITTHPSNLIAPVLNFYKVIPLLSSPILVGPGNPITSLTAGDATGLFFNINNSAITGNTTVLITGNITETGITALNKFAQVSGGVLGDYGFRMTIQPQSNSQVTLTSTNASGMIRLNGASGVTIKGISPTGSSTDTNMVFVSQAVAPAILISNDASNDSIVNMVVRGRNTSTGLINITNAGVGNGNDNTVITGSTLYTDLGTPYAYGIYMLGTSGKENDNTYISNNNIYNFTIGGVFGSTATGINTRILNNHFYYNHPTALAGSWAPITLTPGTVSNGDTISGNYIGGSARFCGGVQLINAGATTFNGITCSVGTNTGVSIQGNVIQNISYTSVSASSFTGINVSGGVANIGTTSANTIGSATVANSLQSLGIGVMTGINYGGTASVNISNNYIGNLTTNNSTSTAAAVRGIAVSTTSLSVTVSNNTIYKLFVSTALTGTTTATPLCGIMVSSANLTQTISGNIISNLVNANTTATLGSHYGIGTFGGVNNISNNQVRNITINTLSAGTTTGASLIGIINTSTSTGQIISGNLVDTLVNNGAASTQTEGIYAAGVTLTLSNNIVRNITSYTTSINSTSTSGIIGLVYPTASTNNNITGNKVYNFNSTNPTVSGINIIGLYASVSTLGANYFQKNFIHSFGAQTSGTATLIGIYQIAGTVTTQNNMIRLGIDASGNPFTGPYNVYGFYLANSSANNIYHNSIYIAGNPSSGSATTAAFFASTGSGIVNVKNNIFVNNVNSMGAATGLNVAYRPFSATAYNSNYNLFYVNGSPTNALVYNGSTLTSYTNLRGTGSWQTANAAAPNDLFSATGMPSFVNADGSADLVDLHVTSTNAIEGAGDLAVASLVTDDYDADVRSSSTPVDVGADAGNFTAGLSSDYFSPIITYTSLTNTASIANRTLSATITDNIGVTAAGNGPTLYCRKGVNGTFVTSPGLLSSGTNLNGTWAFTISTSGLGGLTTGDTVFYFVAAQDDAGNLAIAPTYGIGVNTSTITTYPINMSSYTISQPLATVINVGAGYATTSLTANDTTGVFYRINNGFLQGNTVINIMSDTIVETGTVALNKWLEVSGSTIGTYNYSLTIRPGNGGTIAKKLIVGNATQALIRFNNASNISISGIADGGVSTDTNLVVRNISTVSISNFQLINDASNISFQNVINEGRSIGGALVAIGTTTNLTGNDNISFTNCIFRGDTINSSALSGISCSGTAGKENDNISVIGCTFENVNNTCISFTAGTGNNISIKNNHVYWNRSFPSINTVLCFNLNVGATTNGDTISGNFIGGSARFCAGLPWSTVGIVAPIQTSVGVSTGCYIQGNTIQNFNTSNQFIGMNCTTGGVLNIVGNTIGHATTSNSIVCTGGTLSTGLVVASPGNVTVSGNTIANIFANNTGATTGIRGIAVSGGSVNTSIVSNNIINNLSTNSTSGSTTTSCALQGITMSSSSSNQSITGNTITNLINTNTTTANLTGAHGIMAIAGTNIISNNTVSGITNPSMYTGNLASNFLTAVSGISVLSSGGANTLTNNTVNNLSNLPSTAASTQVVGMAVLVGSNTTCTGNTIRNLNTNSISTGITSASGIVGLEYTVAGTNNVFTNNTIHSLQLLTSALPVANSAIGFYYSNSTAGNNSVSRNTIHSIRNTTAGPGLVIGLFNNAGTTTFSNNIIRVGLDSTGANFSGQLEVRGIYNGTNTNNNFYHNTVYVGGAPNAGGSNTYAFYSLPQIAANNILNIRNNIFYNAASRSGSASGFNYGMKLFDSLNVVSNNNIFAATGTGAMLVGTAGNYTSLRGVGGFNFTTGLDYNSATSSTPFFVNATGAASAVNLRLNATNPAEGNGDATISSLVSVDIDGNSRATATPSDIGASAGSNTASPDIFTPAISFTALGNTGDNVGPRVFSGVTITDQNGIPLTGTSSPRVYYKKGANGTYVSVGSSANSGTSTNASFTFSMDYTLISGGVSSNDTIFYYVLAQDNAGNIISNTPFAVASDVNTVLAHPRNAGFYQIFPSLPANTVIYAGVGQTYPTLTGVGGVFELLNNRSIAGNIDVRITSNIIEPGFVSLNQIGENGVGGYSVTIRPDSLTTGERVLSGSGSLFGLVILNGADRIKFSGVPAVTGLATDRKLRIRNSATGVATLMFVNDATGCKVSNVIIEGAANATTAGVVQFAISTGSLGNSTDTITNCVIRNDISQVLPNGVPANAIYSSSTITALNANNVISGNELLNFGTNGVFVDVVNGGSWTISDNSFYNNLSVPTTSTSQTAISIQPGIFSNGNTITGNYIGGSAALAAGTPWVNLSTAVTFNGLVLNTGVSSTNTVNGNVIQNISLNGGSSASLNGISLTFGKFAITNNQIGHATVTNSINTLGSGTINGIVNNSTDNVTITGNNIQGININSGSATTFNGINITTGICTVSNNTIGHATTANSITFNSSGAFNGIVVTTVYTVAPNTVVSNNRVANINSPLNANYTVSGISFQGTSIATITGNNVHNIVSNSNNSSTNNSEAVIGINYSSGSPAGALISQNNVFSLTASNTAGSAITAASGMYISAATNPMISRNKIYDIRNLSTSTSNFPPPVAVGINMATPGVGLSLVNNQIVLGKDQTTNTEFIGIWQQLSGTFTITAQNNSILITGAASSGSLPSYAYLRGANSTSEITSPSSLVNNVFFNNRSGGSGKHYALANQVAIPTVVTGTNWNPNSSRYNLLVSANPSTLALWGGVDMNIATWRTTATSDNLSYAVQAGTGAGMLNADNLFTNPSTGDLSVQTNNPESWYLHGKAISGQATTDFNNASRVTATGFGSDIGAFEFTTSSTPPSCTLSGSIGTGNTQTISFANREVGQIAWQTASGSFPSALDVKYYTGVNPPSANSAYTYLNSYWNMSATGGSNYTYRLLLTYDDALLGTMASEGALNLVSKSGSGPWNPISGSSSVNTATNRIDNSTNLSSFGLVSGSNQCVTIPVITGPSAACANSVQNYSVPSNSGRTYNWTVSGGSVTSGQGTASVSITWASAGSGSLSVLDSANGTSCKANSDAYAVVINPNPTPVIAGVTSICENNSASYTSGSNTGRTYLWSISGGTISSGQGTASITAAWASAGTGTLTLMDSINATGCKVVTSAYSVTLNAYPTPVITGSTIQCENTSATYSTPSNIGRSYAWVVSGGTISSGQGTNSISVAWGSNGVGTVVVTDSVNSTGCKTTTASYNVTKNPIIASNTITGNQTICTGSTPTTFTGSTPTGGNGTYTYVWESSTTSASAGFAAASGTNNTSNYSAGSLTQTTWYRRTVSAGVCTSITSSTIEVTVNPVLSSNTISSAQTICTGSTPSTLTGSTVTGGNGTTTYLWESSTTSASTGFSAASGTNNAVDYSPSSLTTTTWYRRTASAGVCPSSTTAAVQITVNPVIASNTISGDQTICTGSIPTSFTGSTPTGGNGTYTYAWESSTTSASAGFAAASGTNNTSNYSAGALTQTTWYRRTVSAGICPSITSSTIQVIVNPVLSSNTISSAQTICTGSTPSTLTGSVVTGGNGSTTYLWESSTTSASTGFAAASGTNNAADYSPAALTTTTWYRRTTSAGVCPSSTTAAIAITVNPLVANNTTSSPAQVCIGTATATIVGSTPTGGNGTYTYLWESSTTSASTGFSNASGTNTNVDYVPGTLTQTTWFRRTVTAGICPSVTTTAVQALVNPYPTPAVSGITTICENNSATYTTPSNTGRTFVWNVNGGTISSGQGTAGITVNWGAAGAGSVSVSDSINVTGCKVTTSAYSVTKNAYPTPVISGSSTVCSNSSTSFSTPSNSGRTYVWNVTGGTIASGQGTTSISVNWGGVGAGTVTVSDSVNATGCKTTTPTFAVSINNSPNPVITGLSAICHNQSTTYSTPANAGSAFIWAITGGTITSGLGTNAVTVNWSSVGTGTLVVTDSILAGGCKTTTAPYNVVVNPLPTPVISGTNLVCINTTNTYSTPSNTGRTYVWTVSGGTITAGAGTNSVSVLWNTAGTGTLSVSDSVNATGCKTIASTYNVTVNPVIANNTATGVQTICSGTSATTISGTTPTGGNGTFTYAWESSTTSSTTGFAAASGTNNTINYSPGVLTATTWYRRVVSAGVCSANTSAAVQVTVNPVIASNTVSGVQTICHNTVPTALTGTTPTGGNGTFTYLWESSTTSASAGFAAASGTNNGINYTPGSLAVSTWYRRTVSAGVCTANVSAAIKVTVEDVTKPIVLVQNITRYLNASGAATITTTDIDNGSTDNCGISSRVLSKTSFNCTNVGANTVTFVVTDLIGNKDSATATVTIADTTKPNVITKNFTSYLDASGNTTITVANVNNGSTDNCSIQSTVLSKTAFNCTNVGANTVTLTVTDVNGNIKTGTSTVTILDTIKPTVNVVTGIVLYLNASANIPITTSMINNASFDNCGIASMTVSPTAINCSHIGITPVTLTITDVNGNVNSAVTNVVVFDPVVPVARPKNNVNVYLSSTGQAVINATQLDSASSDNCTITSRVISQSSFNCSHIGANTVSFTVQDQSGNANAANVTVTVLDTIKPTAVAQNRTIYLSAAGTATITAASVNNGSTDNCSIASLALNTTSFTCSNTGSNTVVLSVADGSGNISTASAVITVLDTIKPVMRPKANLTAYLSAAGTASISVLAADSASTDNCSISTKTLSVSSFTCANVGLNTVFLNGVDASGNTGSQAFSVNVLDTIKPIATAQNLTIYLDGTGNASITTTQVNNGSTDNCSVSSLSLSKSTFNCTNIGANNVTLTATDASSNFRTATSVVTVADTTKPTVNYNASITLYLNAAGTATLTTTQVNNGSTDNCSVGVLSLSKTSFNGTNLGINAVTFTVNDVNLNSRTVNVSVNVLDTMKPTAIAQNRTIYLDGTGNASITAALVNNASTDNVGVTTLTLSKNTFNCTNIGSNNVTLTVGDITGNTQTASAIVTVLDTIKPIATAQNLTIYLDGTGNASITTTQVNNGSTDNCSVSSLSLSKSTFNCTNIGANNVTLTATDASSNFRTATSVVTVADTTKPTVNYNASITLYLNAAGTATLTTTQVNNGSTDNCSVGVLSLSKTSFNGTNLGINAVTFTVNDVNLNSRTVNVSVNVLDTMKPTAIAQNRTIYLDGTGNASITAALVNNASTDNVGVTTLTLSKTTFNCTNIGSNNVTLTVGDVSGNTQTASAIVTVLDTIKPIATAQNLTIYLDGTGNASITTTQVNNGSTDNCSVSSLSLSKSTFNCTNIGANNVTLTATDASSNFRTATSVVTVADTTKPTVNYNASITLYLNAAGTATLTTTQVNNGSTDNCSVGVLSLSKTAFTGADLGLNTVTFTVNDVNSNAKAVSVSVNVLDTMKPTAIAQNRTIYLDGTGNASITAALVNNASTDNVGVTTLTLSKTNFNCSNTGANTVTLTVADISGNTSTASAVITVLDTIKPIATVQNLSVYLDVNGLASITASQVNNGSTDNCSISSLSLSKTTFNCSNLGANNVTLTATDASSNFRTAVSVVTIIDSIKPTVSFNNNLNLYLNASGTATLTTAMVNNGSTDNCTISNLALSKTAFTGADKGLNVVTFTVTDNSSNAKAVSVNVIVIDSVRPIAIAQNINAYLNASGSATITAAQVNNGSTDNVGVTSLSLNQSTFNCASLGANTVTLTVGDGSGNSATTTAIVTVIDTIKPIAIAQNLTIQLNQLGLASITSSQVNNGSSDNCSISTINLSKSTFDCSNLGVNNVLVTVTDASGNFRTANAIITVQDTVKPIPAINNNLNLYLNASGTATLTTAMVNNGSSDNCGIASLTLSKTSFTGADRGLNVVTFTVADNSSNSRALSVNIIVNDTMRPIAIAQNRTVYLNASGIASITAAQVNNGSTDNVGVTSLSLNQSTFNCGDLGLNTVTLSVGDASGNTSNTTAIITVADSTKPTVVARNLTVYLNQFGNASITTTMANNGSNDNCGISSLSLTKTDFDCSNTGTNTVTLTATDASNNASSATIVVTVLDTLKPFVTVNNNINIYLDAAGSVTLTPSEVDNGSYDNCSIASRVLSKTTFDGTHLGLNVVTFTVTDASNNSKSVNVNVFVRDTMVPLVKAKNLSIYLSASGTASITTTLVDDGSTDNVGIKTRTLSKSNFNCSNKGANTVFYTIRDASNNESTGEITITVLDTIKPILGTTPANRILGYCNAVQTYSLPTANDNCGVVTVTQTSGFASGAKFPIGITTNTFELADESGNKVTTSFTITILPEVVIDTFPSVDMCQDHGVLELSHGVANMTFSGSGIMKDKKTFDPLLSGTGTHTITASFLDTMGCISTGTFTITVFPVPDKPEIVRVSSNVLAAQKDYYAYQWYRNNEPIAGATSRNYTVSQSGIYGLVVRNQSGCVNGSDPYALGVPLGQSTLVREQDLFKVYPNPSSGMFYIELKGIDLKGAKITMIDMLGKEVMAMEPDRDFIEMNVVDFAPGTYYVKLESGSKFMVKPIVIAK